MFNQYELDVVKEKIAGQEQERKRISSHSSCNEIVIQLVMHDSYININVEDDGVGFIQSPQNNGFGISSIRERVETLNGLMEIDSSKGRGTIVNIEIPKDIS